MLKIKEIFKSNYRRHFGTLDEILWAQIFHNTIIGSKWLIDKSFSPGRWAVGYEFLYVLYRVLDLFQPKSILELGLGQTTNMISQYVSANENISHLVVEHDPQWIKFFYKNRQNTSEKTKIINLDLETVFFGRDKTSVTAYKGFSEVMRGEKFDLVCIDGPFGSDGYSRVDILEIIPDCFEKSFVIMLDDYDREGEQNTVKEMKTYFRDSDMAICDAVYCGQKKSCLITTEDNRFLCSL
ncbi:MAG: hypothetical protein LBI74_10220 [Synergistaceae bacterium]|jgi:hypothetical protein|nr:hypothetical protein [Synergistaceae bacterium]